MVVVKPFGPHHCAIRSASVHACQTSSRGALTVRSITISRSAVLASLAAMALTFLPGFLDGLKMGIQTVEALFPKPAEFVDPGGDSLQPRGLEPTGSELRRTPA